MNVRNTILILSSVSIMYCGQDCFDGTRIIQPIDEPTLEIVNVTISVFPEILNRHVYCTDIEIYKDREAFNEKMIELGKFDRGLLGLCRRDGDYKVIYLANYELHMFIFILAHELCHAVGYNHGDEMDNAVIAIYQETLNILQGGE